MDSTVIQQLIWTLCNRLEKKRYGQSWLYNKRCGPSQVTLSPWASFFTNQLLSPNEMISSFHSTCNMLWFHELKCWKITTQAILFPRPIFPSKCRELELGYGFLDISLCNSVLWIVLWVCSRPPSPLWLEMCHSKPASISVSDLYIQAWARYPSMCPTGTSYFILCKVRSEKLHLLHMPQWIVCILNVEHCCPEEKARNRSAIHLLF